VFLALLLQEVSFIRWRGIAVEKYPVWAYNKFAKI